MKFVNNEKINMLLIYVAYDENATQTKIMYVGKILNKISYLDGYFIDFVNLQEIENNFNVINSST